MPSTSTPRLLFVHAHPDDESLTTGATIAHHAARGHEVTVLTCTLGEEGEVIGERWQGLIAGAADQLGGYRIGELSAALAALGAAAPRFLGGAGRFRDSGMAGTVPRGEATRGGPTRGAGRLVDADPAEALAAMTAVIDALRPHVVVTYDPRGGYGHPDHVAAHRLTIAAVGAARWRVRRLYWTVTSATALAADLAALPDAGLPAHWCRPAPEDIAYGVPDEAITTVVDARAQLPRKIAALRAHATQVAVSDDGRAYALSNGITMPVAGVEHYIEVDPATSAPRSPAPEGLGSDLLAGVSSW